MFEMGDGRMLEVGEYGELQHMHMIALDHTVELTRIDTQVRSIFSTISLLSG